jgi:hypothetical protein
LTIAQQTWDATKRFLRHLFRLRWEYNGITGWQDCPCCEGDTGHQLTNPGERLKTMRRKNGGRHYFTANWVDCRICSSTGTVPVSSEFSYGTYARGYCVGRGRGRKEA